MVSLFGLPKADRRAIAEQLMQWGNIVFGALVLGQIPILGRRFDPSVMVAGIGFWLLAYLIAILIMKGGD